MKRLLFLLGICVMMLGILLGKSMNEWIGYGLILAGFIWSIVCIWVKGKNNSKNPGLQSAFYSLVKIGVKQKLCP